MQVSGKEETIVKPISQQFSGYSAGVPIKKRRFPLILPSSPESEERSTSREACSVQRVQDSNVNVLIAHGMPVVEKKCVFEESKEVSDLSTNLACNTAGISEVQLEECNIVVPAAYVDCARHEEKLVLSNRPAHMILIDKTDLKVSAKGSTAEHIGSDVHKENQTEGKFKSEISVSATQALLPLDLKQPLVTVLAAKRLTEGQHNLDNLEFASSPSLSIDNNNDENCESADIRMNASSSRLQSNRVNWDLNTTMDSWEGYECEAPAMKLSVSEMTPTISKDDNKPLLCSTKVTQIGISSNRPAPLNTEFKTATMTTKGSSEQLYAPNDSLHLCLSSSFQPHLSRDPSTSSVNLDSGRSSSTLRSPKMDVKLVSSNMEVGRVKSEPFDERMKIDLKSDGRTVNHQLGEEFNLEMSRSCNYSTMEKLVSAIPIKCESVEECSVDIDKRLKGISSTSDKQVVQGNDINFSAVSRPAALELGVSSSKTSSSTGLSMTGDVVNHSDHSIYTDGSHLSSEVSEEAFEGAQVTLDTFHLFKDARKQEAVDQDRVTAENEDTEDIGGLRVEYIDQHPNNFQRSGDGFVSDDEKINISADILEEDSYGSDHESDGNQALAKSVEVEGDDDYEDGEVREPLASSKVEGAECERRKIEDLDDVQTCNNKVNLASSSCEDPVSSFVDKVNIIGESGETSYDDCKDYFDTMTSKSADSENKEYSLLEQMAIEEKITEVDMKRLVETSKRRQLGKFDQSVKKETLNGKETTSDQGPDIVSVVTVHCAVEDVKKVDSMQKIDFTSTTVEASVYSDDVADDASDGKGSKVSRIINLPRGSSTSLPGKARSLMDRSLPLPPGRERLPNLTPERRKLHPRRDDFHIDTSQKFSRERDRDQSCRNSRINFLQDRRRFNYQEDTLHGDWDWDCDRDSSANVYGPSEYHVSRQKYGSAFRNVPSRRYPPGDRDGISARGVQMVCGINRNISPNGQVCEHGSDMAGERHNEKFIRGFRDDTMDSVFSHAQSPHEGVDGHFGRGNRNFSSLQRDRRKVHSKSPMRSGCPSPGPWLSPRRSPNVFGHLESTRPRSTMYRLERMRSPDQSCFHGEITVRRHGSPSFMSPSNNLRENGSGRDNDHLRSVGPRRSPSGRFFVRNSRFTVMDHREKIENDEYFDGVVHSGEFDFNENGNGDERRRFGDRRPIRSFRRMRIGDDDNFHVNGEDGSRPSRYFHGDDLEFRERGRMGEREFGRHINNRLGNSSRQRSVEEQEANYRRCDQAWHNDSFGGMSRLKRKRF